MLPHHYRRIGPVPVLARRDHRADGRGGRLTPPLRAATWRALIGLLAVTGMRKSEACHLDRDQVDLDAGVLVITDSKFGKSRQLLLHPTAVAALREYEDCRDHRCPAPATRSFVVSTRGTRLDPHNITRTFASLADDARIQAPPGRRRPRPARPETLLHRCQPARSLPRRRQCPGQAAAAVHLARPRRPEADYWYLQAVPELLALAAGRLEQAFPFTEPAG